MFERDLLKGKRILITGGGSGLGREIAARYLELGAELHICGRRKPVLDASAAELMAQHGGRVETHAVDIRHADDVDAMIGRIWSDFGPLDGLVNNAAGNFVSRTQDVSPRGFDAVAGIVLHGTYYATHHVGRRWIEGGHKGSVISIVVTWVRTGAPFAKALIAPIVPAAMPTSTLSAITACCVSPLPCVYRRSRVSPCFLKMPARWPTSATDDAQFPLCPTASFRLSCAPAICGSRVAAAASAATTSVLRALIGFSDRTGRCDLMVCVLS